MIARENWGLMLIVAVSCLGVVLLWVGASRRHRETEQIRQVLLPTPRRGDTEQA